MMTNITKEQANREAFTRMTEAETVLIDVQRAGDVVPGMTPETILTSGPPLDWEEYVGPQRMAIIYGAMFEGLAKDEKEADEKLKQGEIKVRPTQHHGCAGSVAGIYTASMPVFVVENKTGGNKAFCNFYEGKTTRRLNYGVYGEDVRQRLLFVDEVLYPVIREAVRVAEGLPLVPLITRALHLGDEVHSRNTALTLLFGTQLFSYMLEVEKKYPKEVRETLKFFRENQYFGLRLSMASAKAMADAAHGVEGSSLVTAMTVNCHNFAVRVSGLGDEWFLGPHPELEGKFFEGYSKDDIAWAGGESQMNETVGLGGFAMACAFALQDYQGGSAEAMIRMNLAMYDIAYDEHPHYKIPYFGFRGTPTGVDIFKVNEKNLTPAIDGGLTGRQGGQIGAGVLNPPLEPFKQAVKAYQKKYNNH